MRSWKITIQEELIPKQILLGMLSHRCAILSDSQFGKTNLSKIIVSEFIRQGILVQPKIVDTTQNWRHNFLNNFKCQVINEETTQVYDGEDGVIFDVEYMFPERIASFIGNIVFNDYTQNRERKKVSNGNKLNDWILYVLEESQNSIGSSALNRLDNALLLKAISEGANFNLSYLFIGQRAQDISTRAVERAGTYWIGRTTGDNNTRKLKGLIGSKAGVESKDGQGLPIHERAKKLKLGQFIYYDGATAWYFGCPLFESLYPNNKPQLVEPQRKRWLQIF